jgi:hypothetical protein
MGLSIYYTGEFNPAASLIQMIEEVKDVAIANNWEYHILDTEFPFNDSELPWGNKEIYHHENVYGIILCPTGCEMVNFSFLSNGIMSSVMLRTLWGDKSIKDPVYENITRLDLLYGNFTKTQYAGMEVHKKIVDLFRYLSPKYFLNFHMRDEGYYWETNDVAKLEAQFKIYTNLINGFRDCVESFPKNEGEDTEAYILRMAEETKKLKGE